MAEVLGLKSRTLGCASHILSIVQCAEAETGILTAQKLLFTYFTFTSFWILA